MISVNQTNYDAAQAKLLSGAWRVDPDRGLLRRDRDELAGSLNTSGYLKVGFSLEGKRYYALVHRIVWESYNGPIPDDRFVNHIDGDKTNNAIANLEVVTHRQNMAHAHQTGLMEPAYAALRKRGTTIPSAVVAAVYLDAWNSGDTAREVADRFGMTIGAVRRIKYGDKDATRNLPADTSRRLKVTNEQVREIRRRKAAGESTASLVAEFGISATYVKDIASGKWRAAA